MSGESPLLYTWWVCLTNQGSPALDTVRGEWQFYFFRKAPSAVHENGLLTQARDLVRWHQNPSCHCSEGFNSQQWKDQYSSSYSGKGWAAEPKLGGDMERNTHHSKRGNPISQSHPLHTVPGGLSSPALPGAVARSLHGGHGAGGETSRGLWGQNKYFRSGNT